MAYRTVNDVPPDLRARLAGHRTQAVLDRAANGTDTAKWMETTPEALAAEDAELRELIAELARARLTANRSAGDVARDCGTDAATVESFERGELLNPSWQLLGRYAVAVGRRLSLSSSGF